MADLDAIFKAYDIRGLVPSQLDGPTAHAIGRSFAAELGGRATVSAVLVGHDMRATSPGLAGAFAAGVRDEGVDVLLIGLASTDQLYFASGQLDLPGAVFTASHNPAAYNGIKLCRAAAVAMSSQTGLDAIRERASALLAAGHADSGGGDVRQGGCEQRDVLDDYAAYLHRLVPVTGRRLKVAVDAGNGMAGHTVPRVFRALDVELVPLYFELDGSFPHHDANPLEPANLRDLQVAVVESGSDVGLAFDADADRCFVVDERGQLVSPSALTALIAVRTLAAEPGATIIHNLITSRAVPEIITRFGGTPVRTRVGHSLIKAAMAEHGAAFGGEHSGHFYFRDFWYADSGMLAALHLLAAMAESDTTVSALVADFTPYAASGEINAAVADTRRVLDEVAAEYGDRPGVRLDQLDGLTVSGRDWWLNVRPSNTEPVLRVNVEAGTESGMRGVRDEVLAVVQRSQPLPDAPAVTGEDVDQGGRT
ncbi:MAG: phosphomannomutase/phosphoglucomutase [Nocardioidaceae bacterium]|nr:phosphomannomutase/phosphoglucomutase [Nocardioidaceae bacterium]